MNRSSLTLALKVLQRRKFFTFISLFGISLTLVVLVVAVAMVDDIFAAKKPQSRFDRVLIINRVKLIGPRGRESMNAGYRLLHDWMFTLQGIERASAFTDPSTAAIYLKEGRLDAHVKRTDANYWRILDFQFLEGHSFGDADETSGAHVAVISDRMREKVFGPGPAAGKTFELFGDRYTVIGVVPGVPVTRSAAYADVWVPITTLKSSSWRHEIMGDFTGLVLARSRADFPRLKRDFQTMLKTVPIEDPKNWVEYIAGLDTPFESVAREFASGPLRPFEKSAVVAMIVFFVTLGVLFMTLPALNLVTLNMSRILERVSEIGVRKAFGAPRRALMMQFVLENVILTLIGAAIAFVLAIFALSQINRAGFFADAHFVMNWRVFFEGVLIALFFGAFSGLYPAWRMARLHPVDALRGGAQ